MFLKKLSKGGAERMGEVSMRLASPVLVGGNSGRRQLLAALVAEAGAKVVLASTSGAAGRDLA